MILGAPATELDENHPDWIPSQSLGYVSITHPKTSALPRLQRVVSREIKKDRHIPIDMVEPLEEVSNEPILFMESQTKSVACQTEITTNVLKQYEKKLQNLQNENIKLKKQSQTNRQIYKKNYLFLQNENTKLRKQLRSNDICLNYFKDNDKRTRFYTGNLYKHS